MSFSSTFQPILQDTGILALGCYKAAIGGASVGNVESAGFVIQGNTRKLESGYPKKVKELFLDSMQVTASLTCMELGAAKSLLTTIANSLGTGVVPTVNLDLFVFKPVNNDLIVSFTDIALLQQLSLDFKNDYNTVQFNFEQMLGTATDLDDKITVTSGSNNTYTPSELLSSGNISIGFAKADSFTAVQGVSLNISTEYSRLEIGYPKQLKSLTPLSHSVELEINSEEFTDTAISEAFSFGAKADLDVKVGLYDGTAVTFTLKEAILDTGVSASIAQKDFSTLTKKFIATGDVLLTVA